jgi:hypothetical protein
MTKTTEKALNLRATKKIVSFALAAAVLVLGGGVAQAGGKLNGTPLNGTPLNGTPLNGTPLNGTPLNGTKLNGGAGSLHLEGVELVGGRLVQR